MVRIISVPDGEAPLWVREAWVGLCMPTDGLFGGGAEEVITGKPRQGAGWWVRWEAAMYVLGSAGKLHARNWWVSASLLPPTHLVFRDTECEEIEA